MAQLQSCLRAPARLRGLDWPGLLTRGLYLFSAAMTGAVLYLGIHWPSAAQVQPAAAVPAPQPAPIAVAPAVVEQHSLTTGGLAAGSLITEGVRSVNAARQEVLLAEQAARVAAARPAAAAVAGAAAAPARASATQVTIATAPMPSPAALPAVPSPSPSVVAEGARTAPADTGTGPAQRTPGQTPNHITNAPNHIIVPATMPPPPTPAPTARPR